MCIIVLAIVNFVMDIILGNVYNILGLIVYLSIAACGYYGAKRRDKQLLCCFCGWNLTFSILYSMSIIVAILNLIYLAKYDVCKPIVVSAGSTVRESCMCCRSDVTEEELANATLSAATIFSACKEIDLGKDCD